MYTKLQDRTNQSSGQQLLRKQLLLIGILFVCCVWVLFQIDLQSSSKLLIIHQPIFEDNLTQGFLINTKGCRIQDLDAYDESIREFIYDEDPLVCNKDSVGMLVKSDGRTLYVDKSLLAQYNLTEDTIYCCYKPFWRREISKSQLKHDSIAADTSIRYANYCVPFTSTAIEEQFVMVACILQNDTYIDYFNFVNINTTDEESAKKGTTERISVLVVGIDSVSRLNLYRQMPQTLLYLKDKLKAVEMLGYNKVGDNTFPNLIPVLAGISEEELMRTCWKSTDAVFDNCPFIWKSYKKHGYVTGYGEDAPLIGLFNYLKRGFWKQPTDFYLQAFSLAAEDQIGHEKWLNANLCLGKRLSAEVLIDTAKQFAINLKDRPSFGFFWGTSLAHDYLNLPKYGDPYYLKFFKELYKNGIFNSSIVVFMSDHGIRWGKIRQTYQGYLEERLPFLYITYPDWFAVNYPQAVNNLRANRKRLTTPYDLHRTLKDLIDLRNITNSKVETRLKRRQVAQNENGTSLFLTIKDTRTCNDAGVSEVWCTCHQSETAPITDAIVNGSSWATVKYLNNLLTGYAQCSTLYLNRIIGARLERVPLSKNETKLQNSSVIDYTVTIETEPGQAVFEATVRYNNVTKNYNVMPPVSRLNMYGNQSACIPHYLLKLYCYCKSYWHS